MTTLPLDEFLDHLSTAHGEETWVTLYKQIRAADGSVDGSFYSALVREDRTDSAMAESSWDLMLGGGGPGFVTSWAEGEKVTEYYRQESDSFKRLVIYRDFHGRKESYVELLEEFRLLHNLYLESATGKYYSFDDAGDEVTVAIVSSDEVRIRRSYVRGFMAAIQFNLLLYFERTEHFQDALVLTDEHRSPTMTWTRYSGDSYSDGYRTFVRVLGKKLIRCEQVERCGIWPFERPKQYQDFLVGGDVDAPIGNTCDPARLSNYFGANPGAPHYLTPVFFKKEVMQKYYRSSDYEVSDGHLSRHGVWSLRFDNNSQSHVSVFLGDLGRDLPESEQVYWKSYNVFPDGRSISRTNYERSFLGNFYDPENPEHSFKSSFSQLQKEWIDSFGWPLFLPLIDKDKHYFSSIRSMLTSEQSEFDEQILALAKVTIDSVNVQSLRTHLVLTDDDSKSIVLLDKLMATMGMDNERASALLRAVQSVRSTGVAHRKGTAYEKTMEKLAINENNYQSEFDIILKNFSAIFDSMRESVSRNQPRDPAN
ncbi:hypothetical protein [Xanthomonas citri]|uniref:hypothetical protein n=1 Tax=Xanthomonas citri TaxID=346 RepID=UPI000B5C341E|nr:hypothetical protein [Xanthomonas citri]ASL00629.1 hypothetical protein XcvCFBP7113P_09820 [Xanthomonas citri pv. vignicola]